MAQSLRLTFKTHATTTDNENGIATGWLSGELSPLGQIQAIELGQRHRDISAVYTSDLARAQQTVHTAFAGRDIPVITDARLRECNYGIYNGTSRAAIDSRRGEHLIRPFPNGQSYLDVVQAMRSLLHDVIAQWRLPHVLMVGHSANRYALQHLLGGASLQDAVCNPGQWRPGWSYDLLPTTVLPAAQ